jgi:hypothetical protein
MKTSQSVGLFLSKIISIAILRRIHIFYPRMEVAVVITIILIQQFIKKRSREALQRVMDIRSVSLPCLNV